MTQGNGGRTFVRITNAEIYQKLERQDLLLERINSRLRVVNWIAGTALSICILLMGLLFQHISAIASH
jgi:hypothetical protein